MSVTVIHGNYVHTPEYGKLEILQDVYIGIKNGIIVFIAKEQEFTQITQQYNITNVQEHHNSNKFFVPGFIDCHLHAPQYAYTGTGTDIPLMEWLKKYAFPSEKMLQNIVFAKHLYQKLIKRLIANGTTTAQYFGSIHVEPCLILADIIKEHGVRGFVGKVCMDQYSPNDYVEDTNKSLQDTEYFINKIISLKTDLIFPVITPRFIPTCSENLLLGLGKLATKYTNQHVHIQSHISESVDEIEFVNEMYADKSIKRDSLIFDKYSLLNNKCVMVHAVHCDDKDWKLLASKGVGIAHCPLSNVFFAGGSLDINYLMNKYYSKGLNIGLGTDIAGGYSSSMLNCMRQTVITNRYIHKTNYNNFMNYKHALYLATVGGARCLNLENKIGLFQIGMEFDAVLFDATKPNTFDTFDHDNVFTTFEKIMNLADDRNIIGVWVKGRQVKKQINTSKL